MIERKGKEGRGGSHHSEKFRGRVCSGGKRGIESKRTEKESLDMFYQEMTKENKKTIRITVKEKTEWGMFERVLYRTNLQRKIVE